MKSKQSGPWGMLAAGLVCGLPALRSTAQCNSFPAGGALGGVINSFYAGTGAPAAGSTFVTVSTAYGVRPAGAAPIAAGDLLLVIQMQDAQLNTTNTECYGDGSDETGGSCTASGANGSGATALNNSGRFEYVHALGAIGQGVGGCAAAAGRVCIMGAGAGNGLINAYATAARSATRGQRTYQVVRVPQYLSATLTSSLTAYPWDGRVGGILAFDVHSGLALGAATVSVDGMGFRGGRGQQLAGVGSGAASSDYRNSVSTSTSACNFSRVIHGTKGEGIAGTPRQLPNLPDDGGSVPGGSGCDGYPSGERARGAPGNAGGGGADGSIVNSTDNTGGGGGGNGGAGGQGGRSWASNLDVGGFGGAAFPANLGAGARLVLGGGGGSATRNNTPGVPDAGSGANGGGMVLIRAGTLSGSGTLRARGLAGTASDNDGGGGGGAGGSVVVAVQTGNLDGLVVDVRGGNGGDSWITQDPCVPTFPPGCFPGERHGPGGGGAGGQVFVSVAPVATPLVSGGAPGRTTTILDAYGAMTGAGGVVTMGSVPTDLPGVLTCLVTRASLLGLRVLPGSVEFALGSQRASVAVNVYAESRGVRRLLRRTPIPAAVRDSTGPALYRVATGALEAERLWLEELEAGGGSRWLGPFALDDPGLRAAYEELELRAERAWVEEREGVRRLRPGPDADPERAAPALERRAPPADTPTALKIEVARSGRVQVPLSDLLAAGLPREAAGHPRRWRLWNFSRPVAFELRDGVLSFAGQALDSDYSSHNAYVLTWGTPRPPAPRVELSRSGPQPGPRVTRIERDRFYAPFLAREADPWTWDALTHATPAGPYTFDLPGLADPPALVALSLWLAGGSEQRHRVRVLLNGTEVGVLEFEGRVLAELKGRVPGPSLLPLGNELRLEYTAQGPLAEQGVVFLDALDLGVELPAPTAPVAAARLSAYDPTFDAPAATDYLIVTHADFAAQAERLAGLKRAEGRHVALVDTERAYDRYSGGVFEAAALRELLREARRRTALRDVLLFGDDSFDPRDHAGAGLRSFVPSLYGWDGEFGRVPSENRYADVIRDARPELAIGRLPAQDAAQATLLVDKLEGQAAMLRRLAGRQLFAIDNSGPGDPSYRALAEQAAELLPGRAVFADLGVQGAPAARARLLAGLAEGHQATHYFGHGGPEVWADEGLLRSSDAATLAGSGVQTVLFAWACESQWYQYDWGPSIDEALLLVPDGGALAALGPAGQSHPRLQMLLSQAVYRRFAVGVPLGEAVRQAKAELLAADPTAEPVVEGFGLMGDPALRLPEPEGLGVP